jgi:hypothetical protein
MRKQQTITYLPAQMANLYAISDELGQRRVKQQESPVCYSTIFGEQQPGICAVQEPPRA